MVLQDIIRHKRLSVGAKLLYVLLQDKQKSDGVGFTTASLNELSRSLGVTRSTVIRYKQALIENGLLKEIAQVRADGGYDNNKYQVIEIED